MNIESQKAPQEQLNYQKWKTAYSATYSFGIALPLAACLYISANEPRASNIIPTILFFCVWCAGTVPQVYKDAKKYIQLKKNLQNQYQ
jgi:hypothetical protein